MSYLKLYPEEARRFCRLGYTWLDCWRCAGALHPKAAARSAPTQTCPKAGASVERTCEIVLTPSLPGHEAPEDDELLTPLELEITYLVLAVANHRTPEEPEVSQT